VSASAAKHQLSCKPQENNIKNLAGRTL
jgi:hypothetical protein